MRVLLSEQNKALILIFFRPKRPQKIVILFISEQNKCVFVYNNKIKGASLTFLGPKDLNNSEFGLLNSNNCEQNKGVTKIIIKSVLFLDTFVHFL